MPFTFGVYDMTTLANAMKSIARSGNRLHLVNNNGQPNSVTSTPISVTPVSETDEQIEKRISERFDIYEQLVDMTIRGSSRSLIVSGPPGLGKTYIVERQLESRYGDDYNHMMSSGFIRPTGVYRRLYENSDAGKVHVFDDIDSLLESVDSLNLLKKACDTIDRRFISWGTETTMRDEDTGDRLPTTFEYQGSIIILTNINLDDIIAKGNKTSDHISAMISRSHYIDLGLRTKRDYIVRIKQVIRQGMLNDLISEEATTEVVSYIEKNQNNLREISLRIARKIANTMKDKPNTWEKICNVTCCPTNSRK